MYCIYTEIHTQDLSRGGVRNRSVVDVVHGCACVEGTAAHMGYLGAGLSTMATALHPGCEHHDTLELLSTSMASS